jgi:hypothetical protein
MAGHAAPTPGSYYALPPQQQQQQPQQQQSQQHQAIRHQQMGVPMDATQYYAVAEYAPQSQQPYAVSAQFQSPQSQSQSQSQLQSQRGTFQSHVAQSGEMFGGGVSHVVVPVNGAAPAQFVTSSTVPALFAAPPNEAQAPPVASAPAPKRRSSPEARHPKGKRRASSTKTAKKTGKRAKREPASRAAAPQKSAAAAAVEAAARAPVPVARSDAPVVFSEPTPSLRAARISLSGLARPDDFGEIRSHSTPAHASVLPRNNLDYFGHKDAFLRPVVVPEGGSSDVSARVPLLRIRGLCAVCGCSQSSNFLAVSRRSRASHLLATFFGIPQLVKSSPPRRSNDGSSRPAQSGSRNPSWALAEARARIFDRVSGTGKEQGLPASVVLSVTEGQALLQTQSQPRSIETGQASVHPVSGQQLAPIDPALPSHQNPSLQTGLSAAQNGVVAPGYTAPGGHQSGAVGVPQYADSAEMLAQQSESTGTSLQLVTADQAHQALSQYASLHQPYASGSDLANTPDLPPEKTLEALGSQLCAIDREIQAAVLAETAFAASSFGTSGSLEPGLQPGDESVFSVCSTCVMAYNEGQSRGEPQFVGNNCSLRQVFRPRPNGIVARDREIAHTAVSKAIPRPPVTVASAHWPLHAAQSPAAFIGDDDQPIPFWHAMGAVANAVFSTREEFEMLHGAADTNFPDPDELATQALVYPPTSKEGAVNTTNFVRLTSGTGISAHPLRSLVRN